jgi:carbon monoxide dehydrogenase subunit G
MHFANSVTIHRSPQEVFDYLADFENVPEWNYAVVQTRKTSEGPIGVGTTYQQTRSLPSQSEESFQVTKFESGRTLAIHGDLGPFTGTLSYQLEPVDDGTLLTNSADLEARGLMKLAAPLAGGRIRQAVGANLEKLKEILER